MWFIAGLAIGGVIGALTVAAMAMSRIREVEEDAVLHSTAVMELALLKARVRAIQDKGKVVGRDVMYSIQQPNGKYGKFSLPRVE